jgi:hypothetical protein
VINSGKKKYAEKALPSETKVAKFQRESFWWSGENAEIKEKKCNKISILQF